MLLCAVCQAPLERLRVCSSHESHQPCSHPHLIEEDMGREMKSFIKVTESGERCGAQAQLQSQKPNQHTQLLSSDSWLGGHTIPSCHLLRLACPPLLSGWPQPGPAPCSFCPCPQLRMKSGSDSQRCTGRTAVHFGLSPQTACHSLLQPC